MILLITKKKTDSGIIIYDPSGKEYSANKRHGTDIQWFESKVFDMVTINQPAPGNWSVRFSSGEGDRVLIITNLKLRSSFNKNFVTQGDVLNVDAWLEKDERPLKTREVLEHIKVSAEINTPDGKTIPLKLHDDGTNGDHVRDDGIYTAELQAEQEGDYSLRLIAGGETFKREKVYAFRALKPPFVTSNRQEIVRTEIFKRDPETYLYPLSAALILMAALSGYLFYKNRLYRKMKVVIEKQRDDFRVFLEKQIEERLKEMKQTIDDEGDGNIEIQLIREMQSLRFRFLKSALDGIRRGSMTREYSGISFIQVTMR